MYLYIHDSTFKNNVADDNNMGIVYVVRSAITFMRCNFLANKGQVILAEESIVVINDSAFDSNEGSMGSRLISLSKVRADITMTNFTHNSEGISAVISSITMNGCNLDYNYVPENVSSNGILFADESDITMIECSFYANDATYSLTGGIIALNNVTFESDQNLKILHNKAIGSAVSVLYSIVSINGTFDFNSNQGGIEAVESSLVFKGDTQFCNNTTPLTPDHNTAQGGVFTTFSVSLAFLGATTTFSNNCAMHGGALHAVQSQVYFTQNTINIITNNEAQELGGGIFMYQSFLFLESNTIISNNEADYGGGIYALASLIVVSPSPTSSIHSVQIKNNTARFDGGGVYFSSISNLYVYQVDPRPHNITVILTANTANYGGALYVRDETYVTTCETNSEREIPISSSCFFQVLDLYRQIGTLKLIFESNQAKVAGNSMFGGLLDRCMRSPISSSIFSTDTFEQNGIIYLKNVSNVADVDGISSDPVKICFCVNNKPDCSLPLLPVQTQRGKEFSVSLSAVDQANHPLNATIISELQSPTGGLGDGQQSQSVGDRCTDFTLSVTSSSNNETIRMYAIGPCGSARRSTRLIEVVFSDCTCPVGFDVDAEQLSVCKCVCSKDPRISERISNCSVNNETFLKMDNSWISYDNSSSSSGFIVGNICPFDYCHEPGTVEIDLNIPNGSDIQCANNRAGRLCGECQPGFSLSLGQSGCLKCGRTWSLNTVFVSLAVLTIDVLLVLIMLSLNLTVAIGTLNGFIFSANILKTTFPFPQGTYQTYFISFLNLDVGLNICYMEGFNAYGKTWFEIIAFPFCLIFLVLMIIVASNCFPRFAKFIGKRNVIETLATLIFLSYAKFLQFVINAFSFSKIKYPDRSESVWRADGNIGYWDAKHIIMMMAASVILVPMLIYTFLLFFWQWLLKCPNWKIFALIRNTKLQSFILMHHIPYNKKHRYWTGLLLLIRIIVYVVEVLTSTTDPTAVHLTIILLLTVLLVIKSLHVRVYRKWPIDVLETVLIATTLMVTASVYYNHNNSTVSISITTVSLSTVTMVVLFVGTIAYHVKKHVLKTKIEHRFQKQLTGLSVSTRQRFQSVLNRANKEDGNNCGEDGSDNQTQQQIQVDIPGNLRYLDVGRFDKIIDVFDPPTDSDYNQLYYQQQLNEETELQDEEPQPVQPTASCISFVPIRNS